MNQPNYGLIAVGMFAGILVMAALISPILTQLWLHR